METMRLVKLTTLIALSALLLMSLPAFADSWTVFPTPGTGNYTSFTTNYGGGDGSGNFITSLGPFSFSNPQSENNVPNSWATWGCPPQTESCSPNVLWNEGFSTLTISTSDRENTIGFELEPDQFAQESVTATFHASDGASYMLTLQPNGSAGALLFAVQDDTPGAYITSVDIVDNAGDDFAIAQLRTGNSGTTPEPGSILLFGSGILGLAGVMRRKMNL
jgi:hypothetical protein